ncbi:MAG: DNA-directed RNA polymerase subunit omega [bacterium]|nr:DNA-directed RNA polymerase subunit omega [Coriobacteriales bacterium]MCR5845776.1 DNA-directed RNA polymerase subunit omega [bacterium]
MSIIDQHIDKLLEKTDNDKFLLCAITAKRARDINDMMCGQKTRALQLQTVAEISQFSDCKPLSLAMEEVERGDLIDLKEDEPQA